MYQVLHDEPPPPSTLPLEPPVPAAFDAVAARAMGQAPADRFADAAQMRAALLAAAGVPEWRQRVSARPCAACAAARSDAPTQAMPRPPAVMPRGNTPPTGWDAKTLLAIERHLLPPARADDAPRGCAMRRGARPDLAALIATLARETLDPPGPCVSWRPSTPAALRRRALTCTRSTPATDALPVLGTTPMQPGLVEQAARAGRADRPDRRAAGAPRQRSARPRARSSSPVLAQALTRDAERRAARAHVALP